MGIEEPQQFRSRIAGGTNDSDGLGSHLHEHTLIRMFMQ